MNDLIEDKEPRCYKCVQGIRHPFCDSGAVNDEAAALKVWGTDGGSAF